MMTRRTTLDAFGVRVPTLEAPWTLDELNAALMTIKESGDFEDPLNLGMALSGDRYPFGFKPFLQSSGGDIVNRAAYKSADGALNGDAAVAFGEWWQSLFANDYAPGTSQDPAARDTGLIDGTYAIASNGNWVATAVLEAFGDDTLFLPAPDFGDGSTIGAGSWQFGVSATCERPDGATAFIEHLMQDKYTTAVSNTLGLVPARSMPTSKKTAATATDRT